MIGTEVIRLEFKAVSDDDTGGDFTQHTETGTAGFRAGYVFVGLMAHIGDCTLV